MRGVARVCGELFVLLSLGASCSAAAFVQTDVFVAGTTYPPCFRQPVLGIDPSNTNTVLAFATGRNKTGTSPTLCSDGGDGHPTYVVMRRSRDGGNTFGPMATLYEGSPDYFVYLALPARGRNTTHVLIVQEGSKSFTMRSVDDGGRWSSPAPFVVAQQQQKQQRRVGGAGGGEQAGTYSTIKPAVGSAITTTPSGRVLVPCVCSSPMRACVVFSDDGAASWTLGGVGQEGTRESQLVQVGTRVYVSERNMTPKPGHRMEAWSADNGETLGNFSTVQSITEPVTADWTGIVAGLAALDDELVLLSHPNATDSRSDLIVHVSTDGAVSWAPAPTLVHEGPAGYSDMVRVNASFAALLFENGEVGYADRISLAVFDRQWLGLD